VTALTRLLAWHRTPRVAPDPAGDLSWLDRADGVGGRTRYDSEWPDVIAAEHPEAPEDAALTIVPEPTAIPPAAPARVPVPVRRPIPRQAPDAEPRRWVPPVVAAQPRVRFATALPLYSRTVATVGTATPCYDAAVAAMRERQS